MEADGLHGQPEAVDGQIVIPIKIYRHHLEWNLKGVKMHLPRKIEY
jgi:hypothetical protein